MATRLLVTGSSGLIGSEVVDYFCRLGWEVHGVDNNMRADFFGPGGDTRWNQHRLQGLHAGFVHHELDIRDRPGVDALITGEIHEWETSEYVRDANHLGYKKGLVVIGHAASEEPGLKRIVPWLEERLPGVAIRFVSTNNPFHLL